MDTPTTSQEAQAEYNTDNTAIKEEYNLTLNEEDLNIVPKTEAEDIADNTQLVFEETPLQIKEELTLNIEQDDSQTSVGLHVKDEEMETILPITPDNESCKQEIRDSDREMSDYHGFEDSMDSSEATALTHVEACLDDAYIKSESDMQYDDNVKDFPMIVKEESELTVTETHLISNKVINTTSTITNTHDGLIQSQTTKTLIMEILPVNQHQTLKMGNPEEILPTTDESYDMDCEPFQLNSITGNVLSLEQEAYGILKKKRQPISEGEKIVMCPKCPKLCKDKATLVRHLKVHESIERRENGVAKGRKTRMENRRKESLKRICDEDDEYEDKHEIKKEEKEGYKCTCGMVFRRRIRMETCLRSHTDVADASSFPCLTCDKKFPTKDLLTLHRNRHHRKRYPCKFCPTDYHTQKELFKHLQAHQKVQLMEYKVMSEGNEELQCLLCRKTYSKLPDFKTHIMEGHKEPYKCPNCDLKYSTIMEFAGHVKKTHPDTASESVLDVLEAFSRLVRAWKCEECGKQFHKADKLALHQIEEHAPHMKSEQHFQCEDCQRVFVSNSGLNSHRRVHHRTESEQVAEPAEVGVMCLECRKMCPDMNALTSHMRLHSMDRKYPCKYCDFRFSTPQKRKTHAEIHTGDMKYVCFICEYQCTSENRLKHHKMSIKHLNMKEYLLTGKPLIEEEQSTSKEEKIKKSLRKSEWRLKKRKKERRDSDESTVECDICGDKFATDTEMQDHKQTHPFIEFPNDDKPSRIFFK